MENRRNPLIDEDEESDEDQHDLNFVVVVVDRYWGSITKVVKRKNL